MYLNLTFSQISAELAQTAKIKCSVDIDVKVFGVLGPICESHQPGIFKQFVAKYGNSFLFEFS